MRPHDLQSSNFFPKNSYNFADILTQKNLSLVLGLAVKNCLRLQDKVNILVGMGGFLDTQVQKEITSGPL